MDTQLNVNTNVNTTQVKKPSVIGIITSPKKQFIRMKEKSPILLPLVLIMILLLVSGVLVSYTGLNNPDLQAINADSDLKVPNAVLFGLGAGGSLLSGTIGLLINAAFYKACMAVMKNKTSYKKLLVVVIYSTIISLVGLLINSILAIITNGYDVTYTSLAPLFNQDKGILYSILQKFDIFNVWYYVVLGLGLNIVGGLGKSKTILLISLVFIITTAVSALPHILS